jgi:hypothetical protein
MWVDVRYGDVEIGDIVRTQSALEHPIVVTGIHTNDRGLLVLEHDDPYWCIEWCEAQKEPIHRWEGDGLPGDEQPTSTFEGDLDIVLAEFKAFLMDKNAKYGNSALEPVRVFSQADAREQLRVRMDDKLNRIMNKNGDEDEDVMKDLVGYWFLDRILERRGL